MFHVEHILKWRSVYGSTKQERKPLLNRIRDRCFELKKVEIDDPPVIETCSKDRIELFRKLIFSW